MPFRTALSLKALIAWVTKSGRKLGDFRIANWLWVSVVSPLMCTVCSSISGCHDLWAEYVRPVVDQQRPKNLL